MTLDAWLKAQTPPMNSEAFGRLLGVTGQAVRRWRTGERMPDAVMVEKIAAATAGAVTVAEIHAVRVEWVREQAAA